MRTPLFIAHRGASHDAPENTLAAVRLAWDQKAGALEVDVRRTRDGKLVVFHDENTLRLAGRAGVVARMSLAQLRRLDVGRWKAPQFTGETMPTLAQALRAVPPRKRIFVELKGGMDCVRPFVRTVRASSCAPRQIVPIAFSLDVLRAVKRQLPECETCWVVHFRRAPVSRRWLPPLSRVIAQALEAALDGLDVGADSPWSQPWVDQIRRAGLSLYVWTVDDAKLAKRLARLGVDGITTNRPGWLRAALKETARQSLRGGSPRKARRGR